MHPGKRKPYHLWARFFMCLGIVGGLTTAPSLAQTAPGQGMDALGSALARLPLGDATRAVVAADDAAGGSGTSPSTAGPPDAATDLDGAARQFHLLHVEQGAVAVLAPDSMVVLNDSPGEPKPFFGLGASDLTQALIRSLSPPQWGQITGADGLGYDDLSGDQQALFEQLVAPPFAVRRLTAQGQGADGEGHYKADNSVRTLTAQQCLGVRLRLALDSQLAPVMSATTGFISYVSDPSPHPGGASFWALESSPANAPAAADGSLRQVAPNALKPGQLTLDAKAEVPVPLAPGDGPARMTVGALAARLAAATGVELYVDARLAPRPLWVRGRSAPAADVLHALCLCVTGAVRRVGPAYVLTDDVAGIGAREARIADWLEDATGRNAALLRRLAAQQVPFQPPPALAFAPGDPLAGETGLVPRLFAAGGAIPVGIATLGPAAADSARRLVQSVARQNPAGGVRSDQVKVSLRLNLTYLAPGIGEVEDLGASAVSLDQLKPPSDDAPAPAPTPDLSRFRVRALRVTVADQEDVTEAIHLAQDRGMTELWVGAPPDQAAALLRLAVSRRGSLRLRGVISLLGEPAGAADADQDVEGRSASAYFAARAAAHQAAGLTGPSPRLAALDWRAPDGAAVSHCADEAAAVSRIPGVEGVVVVGTCPPGYLSHPNQTPNGFTPLDINPFPGYAGNALGYTPDARLQFLRRYHVDPVDLTDQYSSSRQDLSLPLFPAPENQRLLLLWRQQLAQRNEALVASLGARLLGAGEAHPVFLRSRPDGHSFGTWDRPTPLPDFISDPAAAHSLSHVVLGTYAPGSLLDDPDTAARALAQVAGRSYSGGDWDGFVVDCSDLTVTQTRQLLSAILPAH